VLRIHSVSHCLCRAQQTCIYATFVFSIFICWLSGKEFAYQCKRCGFGAWVGKIPWRRETLPTPVLWPEEFHGLYSPWSHKEFKEKEIIHMPGSYDLTVCTSCNQTLLHTHTHTHTHTLYYWSVFLTAVKSSETDFRSDI